MKTLWRCLIVILTWAAAGCGSDSGTVTSPGPADVAGTWTGLLGTPGSGSALRMTWTASQSGTSVSGPLSIVKPMAPAAAEATGPLTGTISGSQLSISYLVAAGSVFGYPGCSISGTGSGTLSGSTISGTLMLTFTSCGGSSSGLEPPASNQFSLTHQ
jgi:hypothetical protein